MKKLAVRNWDKWQSYRRDRGQPPWIKVHREVMRNLDWVMMDDAQRGQLVAIWLLAADHDGVIPASSVAVQKLCHMSSEPDLQFFIDQGFIEGDAEVTPSRRQADAPETETEAEKRQKQRKSNGASAPAPPRKNEVSRPDDIDEQTWSDFLAHRRQKKAKLTPTAWKAIRKQLDMGAAKGHDPNEMLSVAMAAGWQGFEFDWYLNRISGNGSGSKQRSTDDVAAEAVAWRQRNG